jgi:hypothetical protein
MEILFDNVTVKTVKADYSWDKANPSVEIVEEAFNDTFDYVGYAPYVNVEIETSVQNFHQYSLIHERKVDFGDYYNSEFNLQTTPTTGTHICCHNYVMPGEYTIKVTQTEYIRTNNPCCNSSCDDPNLQRPVDVYVETFLPKERLPYTWMWYCFAQEDPDPRSEFFGSLQPGIECLTWEDCEFQGKAQATWDETKGPAFETRSKDVSWQWKYVVQNPKEELKFYNQKVRWTNTETESFLARTWKQIKELGCNGINCLEMVPRLSAHVITTTLEQKIKVLEIPPQAYITTVSIVTGVDCTVRLSPKFTRCGSFPIEKIIWDLGDGSPIFECSRWSNNEVGEFIFNNEFELDRRDPRNYDVVHTYNRNFANGSCFYPSITAVTSSTFTTDQAATTIGPVILEEISQNVDILQTQLTKAGKTYMGQIKDQVVFWKAAAPSLTIPEPPKIQPKSYVQMANQRNKFVLEINTNEKLKTLDSNA